MSDEATTDPTKNGDQSDARSTRFAPGNPGGPGRKEGSRNKATVVLDALADEDANEILKKAIELAKGGSERAIEMVLARVWPARKSRPVNFTLPAMVNAADLIAGLQAVLDATASGQLTPDEAAVIGGLIETKRRAIETVEHEQRLAKIEEALAKGSTK